MRYRRINRSMHVDEGDVRDIVAGNIADPAVVSLGSRIEAVRRLDASLNPRLNGDDMARLLNMDRRTIERYRRKIRNASLG